MIPYNQLQAHHRSVELTIMALYPTDEAKRLLTQWDWHRETEGVWRDHYINHFHRIIKNYSRDLIKWGRIRPSPTEWATMLEAGIHFASIKDQIRIQSGIFTRCVRPIHYYRFLKHVSDQRGEAFQFQRQLDIAEKKELIRLLRNEEA